MHRTFAEIGLVLALAAEITMASGLSLAATPRRHHRHAHGLHHGAIQAQAVRHGPPPYGSAADPTPTCRYADGTPFDPDIIGGPNHVGNGGPAGSYGGFDPCGY